MTTSGITNINAKLIHQHPDNPRKDLGDLTELSESIKKKGIMQNLTVIPGHWDENRVHHDEGYTLIIGHRRFAAGKMAGVTMYPCRIVEDMSYKDQVGTMLEENMQRIDLTVLEQAEGFQMMLDLGDTEEQIAEKTGFSRTTVHRRLEIAKLDRDLVKEKTDEDGVYQLNLKDLAELSRIEDVETRNRILKDAADSRQIKWKVEAEIKNKEREKMILCQEKYNRRRISGHISQNQINPPGISPDNSLVSCGSVPCRDNPKSTQFTGMVSVFKRKSRSKRGGVI